MTAPAVGTGSVGETVASAPDLTGGVAVVYELMNFAYNGAINGSNVDGVLVMDPNNKVQAGKAGFSLDESKTIYEAIKDYYCTVGERITLASILKKGKGETDGGALAERLCGPDGLALFRHRAVKLQEDAHAPIAKVTDYSAAVARVAALAEWRKSEFMAHGRSVYFTDLEKILSDETTSPYLRAAAADFMATELLLAPISFILSSPLEEKVSFVGRAIKVMEGYKWFLAYGERSSEEDAVSAADKVGELLNAVIAMASAADAVVLKIVIADRASFAYSDILNFAALDGRERSDRERVSEKVLDVKRGKELGLLAARMWELKTKNVAIEKPDVHATVPWQLINSVDDNASLAVGLAFLNEVIDFVIKNGNEGLLESLHDRLSEIALKRDIDPELVKMAAVVLNCLRQEVGSSYGKR